VIFRELTRVIDVIARLLSGLIRLLLPLVVIVAALFLIALAFVGLDALWSTGQGTRLMLWLLAAMLFFANAVYQDGREAVPYPKSVHRLIYAGLCVAPVLGALALYGLAQRISQYGWTIERSWAVVAWTFLTLFALGYVYGIVNRRDGWTAELARVNTGMGVVVLVVMLLANSPVLDFRRISLSSQLARVESGDIVAGALDFDYFDRNLARPGYLALTDPERGAPDLDPAKQRAIAAAARVASASESGALREDYRTRFWSALTYRPESFDVPPELRALIEQSIFDTAASSVLIRVDLNDDGQQEFVLVHQSENYVAASYFHRAAGEWQRQEMEVSLPGAATELTSGATDLTPGATDLVSGPIELKDPDFRNLEIGGVLLQPLQPD
jgi:hypothetical protein